MLKRLILLCLVGTMLTGCGDPKPEKPTLPGWASIEFGLRVEKLEELMDGKRGFPNMSSEGLH
jgi:hypothetical protein